MHISLSNQTWPFQEWDRKAVEAKERYTKQLATFEANGGSTDSPAGKKRGKAGKKTAPKKSKKSGFDDDSGDESD